MTRESARLQPHPDVVASRVGDELVLVHLGSDRILSLNRTAARVWDLVCAGGDPREIRERILAEFDVTPADLERDVTGLLEVLRSHDLVVPIPHGSRASTADGGSQP